MPTVIPDNCICSANICHNNSPDNITAQKSYANFNTMEEITEPQDVLGAPPAAPALCISELKNSLAEQLLSITMNKLNDLDVNDKISEISGLFPEVALRHSESKVTHSSKVENGTDETCLEMNSSKENVKASEPNTDLQYIVNHSSSYSSSPTAIKHVESSLNNGTESVSYDHIQQVIRKKQGFPLHDQSLAKPITRSLSESCLHAAAENINLNFLPQVKRLQNSNSNIQDIDNTVYEKLKPGHLKTPSMETLPHSQHRLVDEFGLPFNNIVNSVVSPTHNDHEIYYTENIDNSLVSTPPISRCNSTAWSDSYNGSDSWEDLRTESQVLNSVHQTNHHEATDAPRRSPELNCTINNGDSPLVGGESKEDSDENVWRALRDKARATLPQTTSSHGRTIETQVPVNWPPKHGLHFYTEKLHHAQRKHSSSSTESEDSFDDSLSTYLQYSVSYQGDSGPRLLDKPSVELLEGTLLARWCKKDNRTWLWKSSRRWRRFQGFLIDPVLPDQPPAGHFYAKRWKKDNRTWLWKSSIRQGSCKN